MYALARNAALLAGAACLGCAHFPPEQDLLPYERVRQSDSDTGRSPAAVVPATYQEKPTGKAPEQAPPPRPAESRLPIPKPAASPGTPITLDDLEALADRVNPILVRDQAQIESQRGSAVQAGLWSNPRWDTNNPWVVAGRGSLMNVGFQQEVPVMGKKKLDESAANEATRQAEIAFAQDRAAVRASIRQQFYTVLVDQERVDVLTRMQELVRKSYETGVARQRAGDMGTADVALLLVDYQRAQAALRSAAAILDGDRTQLEAMVGAPGILTGPLSGQLRGEYPAFDERQLIDYVTRNHTQVLNALSVIRQNRILVRRAEVEPYPNPTVGPAYQFGLVPGNDQFWFNFTFNVPVWDLNQGNIRAAKANVGVASAAADATRLGLVQQAANLLSHYRAARAVVERFEGRGKSEPGIVANSEEAARIYQVMFANKTTDLSTLIQAQRTAMLANSDYIDALLNLWSNATQISGLLQQERFPVEPVPNRETRPEPAPATPRPPISPK
jgi:cobalt-zinc-cadmium efflux system outer membrane protein